MTYPWKGEARPLSPGAFARAAETIGCETAAIHAVWEVEAAGRGYLPDGTVIRRFEPHKMPGASMGWRESLKIGTRDREAMFVAAWKDTPEAALRATSWGGPQIMGFNAGDAGFPSAEAMVRAMAQGEDAQLDAFVDLVCAWGLDSAIRAHDWQRFETVYNGGGQGGAYARKIEAAYRRHSGKASPQVLRFGDRGAAVRRLQEALGIEVDGSWGADTETAVRAFQERAGLPVDGIVGKRTWAALEEKRDANPKAQPTSVDRIADKAIDIGGKVGGGAVLGAGGGKVLERVPDGAVDVAAYGLAGLAVAALALVLAAVALKVWRDA